MKRLSGARVRGAFAMLTLVACACTERAPHPYSRASTFVGRVEADLRRELGPPTHETAIGEPPRGPSLPCLGMRQLSYEIPTSGFEKSLRDFFDMGPRMSYEVCVDSTGRIAGSSVWYID